MSDVLTAGSLCAYALDTTYQKWPEGIVLVVVLSCLRHRKYAAAVLEEASWGILEIREEYLKNMNYCLMRGCYESSHGCPTVRQGMEKAPIRESQRKGLGGNIL